MSLLAYLDDSGKDGDLVVSIGGATAQPENWTTLADAWRATLARFEVGVFHATDFNSLRGQFTKWRDDRQTAECFIRTLIALTRKYVRPLGAAMPFISHNLAFGVFRGEWRVKEKAHDFCFEACLSAAAKRADALSDKVDVIFANTPKYVGRAAEIHAAFQKTHEQGRRLGGITQSKTPQDVIGFAGRSSIVRLGL